MLLTRQTTKKQTKEKHNLLDGDNDMHTNTMSFVTHRCNT